MPFFFMLPYIIMQGMLEVALDDVRTKPKTGAITGLRFPPTPIPRRVGKGALAPCPRECRHTKNKNGGLASLSPPYTC